MSNSESLNVAEALPPEDSSDLFVYSPATITSQDQKVEDGVRCQNSFSRLKQQRVDGQFCDVTFVAGAERKKIVAHRNVLAGATDYFATMFTCKMKEETDTDIMMVHVRADVLELIVNYCYGDPISITINSVQALYKSAHLMQFNHIVKACSQFLIKVLHSSNCVRIKLFAELMGDNELLQQAKSYLEKHFSEVIEQQELKHLNFDQLMLLLQRDNLKLERDEFRFSAVKSWVEHNPSERRNLISSLMSLVKLNLLRPEYLVNTVEDFLPNDPTYKTLYMDALKSYLFTYNNKVTLKLPKTIESTKLGRVLVVGPNVSDSSVAFIECYHPESIAWSCSHKMYDGRQDFQIAVFDEKPEYLVNTVEDFLPNDPTYKTLYMDALKSYLFTYNNKVTLKLPKTIESTKLGRVLVVGPNVSDSSVAFIECYHPESIAWSCSHKMYDGRQDFQIAVFDENLYVIGGSLHGNYSLTSVMCLNLRTSVWSQSVPMNTSRHSFGVAVLDGFIYAIGGLNNNTRLNSVERWKPTNTAWERVSPTKNFKSNLVVAVLNGMVYAVGGESVYTGQTETIECYNPSRNEWKQCRTLASNWTSVGVVTIGTHLYVMRRQLARTMSNPKSYSIERYDPGTDTWTLLVNLSNAADTIATCLLGERILIVSSYDKSGSNMNTIEEYDPNTNSVTALTSLRFAKASVRLAVVPAEFT